MDAFTAPDFTKVALVTIDTQVDVLDGQPFEIPGTSAVLPRIHALLEAFRAARAPIVHVVRIYERHAQNVDRCRRAAILEGAPLLLKGSPGCELAPALRVQPDLKLRPEQLLRGEVQSVSETEAIIYKPRWGAFFQTPLEDHLRRLAVDTLVFCGCNFPNCPRTSIYEASERDFRVVLAEDAVSGLYDKGRAELANIGVALMDTPAVVRALEGR